MSFECISLDATRVRDRYIVLVHLSDHVFLLYFVAKVSYMGRNIKLGVTRRRPTYVEQGQGRA